MPTYEEAREEYERKMGAELGKRYHLLWNECAQLHIHWCEFVAMFGKDQEQFDVMNCVAPGLFKSIQDAFWQRTLLHLCRFADNGVVGHRKTLSLDSLLMCKASAAVPELPALITVAKARIKFAQDWRNRSLAHLDLDFALERSAQPLAQASRVHVKEALSAIKDVLQSVDLHFTGMSLYFDDGGHDSGVSHLFSELRLSARLREEREKRIDSGAGTQDDFDWQKWR